MSPRIDATILAFAASTFLAACAGNPQPQGAGPANIGALEAARERNPNDAALLTRLGIAYYNAKDYPHARDVLGASLALDRRNFAGTVYQGLTYEELGQLDSARASYTAASAYTTSAKQRGDLEDRLTLLTRRELREAARQAIAQEAALSSQPPPENTVAVLPFRYVGTNDELRPLEVGLTHLLITDLSKVSRLRLLERERVQSLIDELKLADEGRVDPSTGARSGRLLRAARVVQGSLQDVPSTERLKLDAAVVNSTTSNVLATGSAADKLQQLFDMEKQVVQQLLQRMGITLTPAEQRAVSERPTADLQAFLAFSRGLEAEDRGDFAAAAAAFNAAAARDPSFRSARDRAVKNFRAAAADRVSPTELAGLDQPGGPPTLGPVTVAGGRGTTLQTAIDLTVPSTGSSVSRQLGTTPVPANRPPLPEALGNDSPILPGLTGAIIIIITRP